jgi:peptidoglycan/xylan/chitin deacetylase (PgdA/CDA1 family)
MMKALLMRAAMLAARPFYGGIGAVHVMHRIVPKTGGPRLDNPALELDPHDLDAILSWMKARRYDFITLDELPARLDKPGRRKFVCFTFDDGYRDNLENALPIFERHEVPFTLNITTAYTDHAEFVWWYALEDLLCAEDQFGFTWEGREHGFALGTMEEKLAAFEWISRLIRSCDLDQHQRLLAALFEAAPFDPMTKHGRELILGWDEVTKMDLHPLVTIGSHGIHHLTSSKLDETALVEQFAGSKRLLEQRLNHPVRHIAYPFGGPQAVGRREFQCARECGYATAVTTRSANLFPASAAALHHLPRLCVSGNYEPVPRLSLLESGLVSARQNGWKRLPGD